nr:unnamed protein product [Callosobruchus chinensis]
MWLCNECKSSAPSKSKEQKCLLLQKEVDCLKRELSCTMKLLEGLEYTVELQKSLLKCNEGNKSISSYPPVNHLQPGSSTYSEALKKPKVNNSSVLLIKANNDVSDTDVLHDITTSVNPAQINACIDNTRKIKNGLMVLCEDEKSLERLKVNLNSNKALNSKYTISEPKKFKPRLLVKNVKLNNQSPEQVVEGIITLNKFDETSYLKCVTKLKHFQSTNLIIEVSPDLRKIILKRGYIHVGWKKCEVSDHIHILRCSKCCGYGHTVKDCNLELVCGKCAQHHKLADCQSTSEECVNCINFNKSSKRNVATNHACNSKECTVFNNYIDNLNSRIDYG